MYVHHDVLYQMGIVSVCDEKPYKFVDFYTEIHDEYLFLKLVENTQMFGGIMIYVRIKLVDLFIKTYFFHIVFVLRFKSFRFI